LLSKPEIDADTTAPHNVIFEQLEGKSKLLNNHNNKVSGLCVMDHTERKYKEFEAENY